ncbi:MAG: DUF1631 family protein [Burkholderiaceae bacterium]
MTMHDTPAANSPSFGQCLAEASRASTKLADAVVRGAIAGFTRRMDSGGGAEAGTPLGEARRQLGLHHATIVQAFGPALEAAIAEATRTERRRVSGLPSFDQLELMDESQVQESVEVVRAQQAALLAVEAPLAELTALVSAAQGLPVVQADRNPLRPEIYVKALRQAVGQAAQAGVLPGVRLAWLQQLGEALGPELKTAYTELIALLKMQGVTAAAYGVTTAPEGGYFGPSAKALASAPGAPSAPVKTEEVLLTVDRLRRLLAGELDQPAQGASSRFGALQGIGREAAAPPDFGHTVPAAFEALQEMKQVDKVMERLAGRNAATSLPGQPGGLREQLRREAHGMGQSLAIEVVHLMVDNLSGDGRLLPPVQQAVRDLEPALLRLALVDQRFFSDRGHPARRLLEQMTQRSLGWEGTAAPGFAEFLFTLRQAVDALAVAPIEDASPFADALARSEKAWEDQKGRERQQRTKAVHALLNAEQRNILAQRIARELQARPDIVNAPAALTYFLFGPWAQVIAQARLSDREGKADPGGYQEAINDLLWTAQPELARQNLPRMTRLVPTLVKRLREGLASIDYPKDDTESFFDDLMALHQHTLKPGAPRPAAPPKPTREELEAQFDSVRDNGPWLAPREAQDSGFLDTDIQGARPAFQATQPWQDSLRPAAHPAAAAAPAPAPARLEPGTSVEMQVDGKWAQMQLTWASPHGTLFMFTGPDGNTRSLPRRALDQMQARGELRPLAEETMVDGALNAVAEAAMRNSLDLTL